MKSDRRLEKEMKYIKEDVVDKKRFDSPAKFVIWRRQQSKAVKPLTAECPDGFFYEERYGVVKEGHPPVPFAVVYTENKPPAFLNIVGKISDLYYMGSKYELERYEKRRAAVVLSALAASYIALFYLIMTPDEATNINPLSDPFFTAFASAFICLIVSGAFLTANDKSLAIFPLVEEWGPTGNDNRVVGVYSAGGMSTPDKEAQMAAKASPEYYRHHAKLMSAIAMTEANQRNVEKETQLTEGVKLDYFAHKYRSRKNLSRREMDLEEKRSADRRAIIIAGCLCTLAFAMTYILAHYGLLG